MKDKEGKRSHRRRPGCWRGQAGTTVWGPEARQGWGGAGATGPEVSGGRNGVESVDNPGTHSLDELWSSSPSPAGLTLPGRGRSAMGTKSAGPKLASGLPTCAKSTHACPCVSILGPQLHKPCKGAGVLDSPTLGKVSVSHLALQGSLLRAQPLTGHSRPLGGSGLVPISVLSPIHPKLVHFTSQIPVCTICTFALLSHSPAMPCTPVST